MADKKEKLTDEKLKMNISIIRNIDKYMLDNGIKSDRVIYESVGMDQPSFSNMRNGKHLPDITKIARIASTLGCSIDELIGIDKPTDKEPEKLTNRKICEFIARLCGEGIAELDISYPAPGNARSFALIRIPSEDYETIRNFISNAKQVNATTLPDDLKKIAISGLLDRIED